MTGTRTAIGIRSNEAARSFVWPPLEVTPTSPEPEAESCAPAAHSRWHSWREGLLEAEQAWLGGDCLRIPEIVARGDWRPDHPAEYCNRCGETIGEHEATEFGCAACRDLRPPWDRFVRLGPYEGELARFVREFKFQRRRSRGADLGRLLGQALLASGVKDAVGDELLVVPAPMAWRRRMMRGIDHAGVLARQIARTIHAPCRTVLWCSHRPSQRSVAASARASNLRGSIRTRRRFHLEKPRIVVVDDVRTTGATLRAACRAIRAAPVAGRLDVRVEIWVACVSVTPSPERRSLEETSNSGSSPAEPAEGSEKTLGTTPRSVDRPLEVANIASSLA